jgi:hypothetical protein
VRALFERVTSMNPSKIQTVVVGAAATVIGVGCATRTSAARAPSVDLEGLAPAPSACVIQGAPRVVATRAMPPAGIDAQADSSHVWLRFAQKANWPLALAVDPETLNILGASDPTGPVPDSQPVEVPVAWRVDRTDPLEGASLFAVSSRQRRDSAPSFVRLDAHRSVIAWTEGSIERGLDVRVLTVGDDGVPIGIPVAPAHEGSAIGVPRLAFADSGRGVVAFLESNGSGFQVVAASLDCGAPATALEASISPELLPVR